MAINKPTQTLLDVTNTDLGAASLIGGYAYPFQVPSDVTTIAVRFRPSVLVGHMGVILQTSPDGGTTFYDVARTSTMSLAYAANAQFLVGSSIAPGMNPRVGGGPSVLGGAIGAATASSLGSQQVSGLPLLGQTNRLFMILGGSVSQNDGCRAEVFATGQISNN